MRNFQRLAWGLNTAPTLNFLNRRPDLWNRHNLRRTFPGTPHSQVDDIWLRFQDTTEFEETGDIRAIADTHENVNYPAMFEIQGVRPMIFDLMRFVEGERLGRCLITRLRPGGEIAPHADGGAHAAYYDRYHIVLQGAGLFGCGEEEVRMQTGEVWWFDNSIEHWIYNDTEWDRIHLIVDIRTAR